MGSVSGKSLPGSFKDLAEKARAVICFEQPWESKTPTPDMVTLGGERHEDRASSFWERKFPFQTTLTLPTWFCVARSPPAHPGPPPPQIDPFRQPLLSHTRT